MSDPQKQMMQVIDKDAIKDCLFRLARGEDRRDAELITSAYWPDSVTDYGVFKGNFEEYLAWVVPGAEAILLTQHTLGQSYIQLQGSSARVETCVTSYHRVNMGDREADTVIGGRYLDELEKRDGEWRIKSRTMLYDWFQDFGDSADFSQGVMGIPFSGSHFVGGIQDDFSATFFK
ncbi:nuclear transport factor 2 family protein [Halioxenophilus aromaticivorans]|uniref:SnoaL-like domain-containing protein n=1 Tax=Halioxenophilus aromaticivorans TaxID=1306992 RepID=A0AAV3UA70_9ALTE